MSDTTGKQVFICICLDDRGNEDWHIFSTPELAQAYADRDTERSHVLTDYVIDCPERHDELAQ